MFVEVTRALVKADRLHAGVSAVGYGSHRRAPELILVRGLSARTQDHELALLEVPQLLVIADKGVRLVRVDLAHVMSKKARGIAPVQQPQQSWRVVHLAGERLDVPRRDVP